MKTFNDLFNVCNNISENGIMNVQADDVVEVIDFAKTVLSNILWFVENYEDENPTLFSCHLLGRLNHLWL